MRNIMCPGSPRETMDSPVYATIIRTRPKSNARKRGLQLLLIASLVPVCAARDSGSVWKLNALEYFETPGASFLVFHNDYPSGKQGGLEIIQHGERVASCGDVGLEAAPGQWSVLARPGKREVNAAEGTVKVPLSFPDAKLDYTIRVQAQGDSLRVSVDLARPLPPELEGKAGLNLELFPPAYFGKTYHLGKTSGVFPRQANGPMLADGNGALQPAPLARGPKLVVAPEDPLRRLVIEQVAGEMELLDGRNMAQNGWFVLRAKIPSNVSTGAVQWIITPNRVPGWHRDPVVAISQVGYHPDQVKQAVIEWDPLAPKKGNAVLRRITSDGALVEVLSAKPKPWQGKFLRYDYGIFDFTDVRQPGMYILEYRGIFTSPFLISRDVYRNGVWQPTLETYFPVQMCHVEVRDAYRVWHGACHLDDALQAPASHTHFDGYRQGPTLAPSFGEYQHIPYLDRGGWHDAGDYDLAAGSQAATTLTLALIRETFGVDTDQTTVREAQRLVILHTPDGVPDIVQQVAHGVENLLSGYRAAGYSFTGIIENDLRQYVHLGDASTITDNRVYDPSLGPDEVKDGKSGRRDDRWVFTDRDTSLEYKVAAALAAASRVLKGYDDALARECIETARKVWDHEQTHPPVSNPGAYVPDRPEVQEILCTVELLKATGEPKYRDRLVALLPTIQKQIGETGWAVARVLPQIQNDAFKRAFDGSVKEFSVQVKRQLSDNPFGVLWRPAIWGIGWNIQTFAMQQYYLVKACPDLFDREQVLRVLNYVLGCHPGSDISFVSGVGARSITSGYGFNRADWSYIPGMVASGTALIRPDFPELKDDFPFLWQQTENVIRGAATYIFTVLAADDLLNRP
jgi:hypothetical protein